MDDSKLIIGICAMDSKARSKPMRKILERLLAFNEFEVIIFGDKVILDESVPNWPVCDILISFYSKGFPLQKAIEYVNVVKPFCINDLLLQHLLLDRRLVMLLLDAIDVPTPTKLQVSKDNGPKLPEELLEIVGRDFNIDFSRPLFQCEEVIQLDQDTIKCGDKFLRKPFVEKPCNGEDHNVYIYYPSDKGGGVRKLFRKVENKSSEFVPNINEIRKDGSYIYEEFIEVENQEDVKVYTVGLNYSHAETRKSPIVDGVVRRNADGKEVRYVTLLSDEEQEIARRISMAFGQTICGFDLLRSGNKSYVIDVNGWSFVKGNDDYYNNCSRILRDIIRRAVRKRRSTLHSDPGMIDQWRLKSFIGVFRHADRTPKQKVKVHFLSNALSRFLIKNRDTVIKNKDFIAEISKAITEIISVTPSLSSLKMEQLLEVLRVRGSHSDTKLQLKPIFDLQDNIISLIIIAKWGGEFTHAGRHQSKDLGDNLQKELAILNKKIVEDVQVYSSSERRALATADVFSKAFMPLAELPADFVKVNKEWLDDNFTTKEDLDCNRSRILEILNQPVLGSFTENTSRICDLVEQFNRILKEMRINLHSNFNLMNVNEIQRKWCCSETPLLFKERWDKLIAEFCDKEENPDIFKISEIYDSLKYDVLHNRVFMEKIFSNSKNEINFQIVFEIAKILFKKISPLEYGVDVEEKKKIGKKVSAPLLKKIIGDLQEASQSQGSPCFTRFYVTKESHMYTLLNLILHSNINATEPEDLELDYLSQICFELYEKRFIENGESCSKFSIRIGVSPGAHNNNLFDLKLDSKHSLSVLPKKFISEYLDLNLVLENFIALIK